MNKVNLLCLNVVFFATSRFSELGSIVTAFKFSKIFAGNEPPLANLGGGGAEALQPPSPILYAYDWFIV